MNPSSSYHKIYCLLLATPDGHDLYERYHEAYSTAKLDRVTFRIEELGNQRPKATPTFVVKFGERELAFSHSVDVCFADQKPFQDEVCLNVVEKNFGKSVKTYNCKETIVSQGSYKKNVRPFPNWVRDEFQVQFKDALEGAVLRVKHEIQTTINSEEFKESRTKALKDHAIAEIVKVMSSYAWLGKDVLKDGLDTFVCHDIITT